jgi:carboxypeptidase C (cathepsin A)
VSDRAIDRRNLVKLGLAAAFAAASVKVRAAVPGRARNTSRHRMSIMGRPVTYDVEAGDTILLDSQGARSAALFTFSYLRRDAPSANRPVIFFFGGGPGGSSMSFHVLSMGPRVALPVAGQADRHVLADNRDCLLDVADLVYIDPVGAGFSDTLPGVPARRYWGLFEDAEAFAQFIETWLKTHGRSGCPIYLVGVSYGTVRAATLSHRLHTHGTPVAGVVLNSSVINYCSTRFAPGNDLAYIYFLPSYAAIHHFHARSHDIALPDILARTESFALERYAPALAWGHRADAARQARVAAEMADLIGLPPSHLLETGLRVRSEQFMVDYGRPLGFTLERNDGRKPGLGEAARVEAFRTAKPYLETPVGTAIRRYFETELGLTVTRPYADLSLVGGSNWNWEDGKQRLPFDNVDMAVGLADDLRANPRLRVMMAAGYYDLATPYFASEMVLSSHGMPRDRVIRRHYAAGHGVHRDPASLLAFQADMREMLATGV